MLSSNLWGGSFEMHDDDNRDVRSRLTTVDDNLDRGALTNQQQLDQAQQSWFLGPKENKRKKYIDFGCVVCSRQAIKWSFWTIVLAFVVIALPTIIVKHWPKDKVHPPVPDQYEVALHKALQFFDAQKCVGKTDSKSPNDHNCWQKPEDMKYPRPVQTTTQGADLASEMAAALASASIVFMDNRKYSQKLIKGASALFAFGRDKDKRVCYSKGNVDIEQFYNSSNYYDEYMWGAAWMYYATGNSSYLSLATNPGIPKNANAFFRSAGIGVLSWDNKLPAAELLLTRMRIFLSPGYPYEDMLRSYQNLTSLNMCSYLKQYNVYNFTRGGLILMNHGGPQNLQYAANAAFIASLYVDYMNATGVPGWYCGPTYIGADSLYKFATSQVDYILGANPQNMSYVVGYGAKFPKHVHHRGASIPSDGHKYSCTEGLKWRDTHNSNPHNITGAMVGGPDRFDGFHDVRTNYNYTEPTLAGNAGLVAALVSLTTSGGSVIDKNTMFSGVPPLYPTYPPPPPPWKP
ncbi:hypothetical protein MKX01_022092 [Papaver californicum]|nr:hypothetical protein MKX01_022092 [Papaver californicum]